MAENDNNSTENLLEAISRHVFLVLLHISWPKLSYKIDDAIVELTAQDGSNKKREISSELRTQPHWQLMPDKWRLKLVNLESRARALLSSASRRFAAKGVAVLPVSRAQDVFTGLRALRAELYQYRDEFIAGYAAMIDDLRTQLNDTEMFEQIMEKLPNSEQLAGKFNIVWAIIPAGGRSTVPADDLTYVQTTLREIGGGIRKKPSQLARAIEIVQTLLDKQQQAQTEITDDEAADVINEARQQMQQFTQEMLADMTMGPRADLVAAADNILNALTDSNRIIRSGTINQLKAAFELLEGFSFLAGPELLRVMRDCRQELNNATPKALNADVDAGAKLAAVIRNVRDIAADSAEAATAIRQFRNVRIRDQSTSDKPARRSVAV